MWVLQELAVSKDPVLCCGPLCAPWSSVLRSFLVFRVETLVSNGVKLSIVRHRYQKEGVVKFYLVVPLCFDFYTTLDAKPQRSAQIFLS